MSLGSWSSAKVEAGRLTCVIGVRIVEDLPEDRSQADLSWVGISLNTVQVTC